MNIAIAFEDMVEQLKYRQEQVDNLVEELSAEKLKVAVLSEVLRGAVGIIEEYANVEPK